MSAGYRSKPTRVSDYLVMGDKVTTTINIIEIMDRLYNGCSRNWIKPFSKIYIFTELH